MSPNHQFYPKGPCRQPAERMGWAREVPSRSLWDFMPPFLEPSIQKACPFDLCVSYRPLSTMQPSLMTRIWSALTTVESLRSQRSVAYYPTQSGHTASRPRPVVLYLCATTMVVRLAQTLAREAWMALSLDVSSADVACREGPGKTVPATQNPNGRRRQAAG